LPEYEFFEPTAAYKYYKKYLCNSRRYVTSNLLNHLLKCPKKPRYLANDPKQTILTFQPGKSEDNLVLAIHRFNVGACRKTLATFVILDEQPFKVVEGKGFKHLCR